MATRAVVGVLDTSSRRDAGWVGTWVGVDGDPESLGPRILDLVLDHDGDLRATWEQIASAPAGWRAAFTWPYDHDHDHGFATGRSGPPLLRHGDDAVTGRGGGVADYDFLYLIDLGGRRMRVHERLAEGSTSLLHDVGFQPGGEAVFGARAPDPLHWTNRRRAYAQDDPEPAARAVLEALNAAFPIQGPHLQLNFADAPPRIDDGWNLVVPLITFAGVPGTALAERIGAIVEHPTLRLVSRRALMDGDRAVRCLEAALATIAEQAAAGGIPCEEPADTYYANLFPTSLLDLEVTTEQLVEATKTRIREAFDTP